MSTDLMKSIVVCLLYSVSIIFEEQLVNGLLSSKSLNDGAQSTRNKRENQFVVPETNVDLTHIEVLSSAVAGNLYTGKGNEFEPTETKDPSNLSSKTTNIKNFLRVYRSASSGHLHETKDNVPEVIEANAHNNDSIIQVFTTTQKSQTAVLLPPSLLPVTTTQSYSPQIAPNNTKT